MCFLMRDRKRIDPDGRGRRTGGSRRGETVISTYYVRKKKLCSIKGKQTKKNDQVNICGKGILYYLCKFIVSQKKLFIQLKSSNLTN